MTEANGYDSHSEGKGTVANGNQQHVQGRWNEIDTANEYAHIVGNGTSASDRKNIHTLDWEGDVWYSGSIKVGGNSYNDINANKIATEKYVDDKIDNIESGGVGWAGEGHGAEIFNDQVNNQAIGIYSHAEGQNTRASRDATHAEGHNTSAEGYYSHAEGLYTQV